MSEAADQADSALAAEAERQHRLIMRGTRYGDQRTRETMSRELRRRLIDSLANARPLRVYLGVDPTSPDLHIGHCVSLRKLRLFQQLGHQAILLIGDFTGLVGDPSDKDSARPMQTAEVLEQNARTYRDQAFKLLDPQRTELRRNSEWLAAMSFADVIQLAANFTLQQFAERDTFARRLDAGQPVYLHEFMYGLMQGYDAVALEADVQLGGTDQTFNIGAGRTLQERFEQPPQIAVLSPILVGTDGAQRMSKSSGNYIGINEPPLEQYGKAMSIPDRVIEEFLVHGTNLAAEQIDKALADMRSGRANPMQVKQLLAGAIVREWHSEDARIQAEAEWTNIFIQRTAPEDMPSHFIDFGAARFREAQLPQILVEAGMAPSNAAAKRLIAQGAVRKNDEPWTSPAIPLQDGDILKIGKRKWLRIQRAH